MLHSITIILPTGKETNAEANLKLVRSGPVGYGKGSPGE